VPPELHALIIHFALALLATAPLFDLFGLLLRREALLAAGRWNTWAGTLSLLLAVGSGLAAESALGPYSPAGVPLLSLHGALGYTLVPIWLAAAVWRRVSRGPIPVRFRTLYLALTYVGAVLVFAEGGLGSMLVYRHGVGLSASARAQPVPRRK
jgi:uncharacterized membrane protein